MDYEIFVDMSLDIDVQIAEQYGIRFVPMEYMLGGETFRATGPESDARMHNFYESMRQNIPTKTSQITPYQYEETFGPVVKEGKAVLYIALSGGLSKTYESALLAAENLKDEYENVQIEVIDSRAATGGMGLLAESAAKNREAGMSLEENAKWLRNNVHYVNHWFMVEDLVYLRRGGRISAATAIVGSALNIKPILKIDAKGELVSVANKRGSKQAMRALAEYYRTRYDAKFGNAAYICCADCRDSAAELKEMVLNINPDADVRITMLCPVIGAHTGPGMLSMIFYGAAMD
ncbi:MAG: DegV family protein [Clostridiales bacterium]|nr:DegV family protein [Clostridiales bacterium]